MAGAASSESPLVVVTDAALMAPKGVRSVRKQVRRPEAEVMDGTGLGGAADLRATLARYPDLCHPPLSAEATASLAGLGVSSRPLLVAASIDGRTASWRWDAGEQLLSRQIAKPASKGEVSGRVVAIHETDLKEVDARLGYGTRTLLPETDLPGFVALRDDLLEHPNECDPPLTPVQVAALTDLSAKEEGDLYVSVTVERFFGLWRWDAARARLTRVEPN